MPNTIGIVAVAALAAIEAAMLGVATTADQVSHQRRQAIKLALQRVVLDSHVLAVNVAGFTKPLAERGHNVRRDIDRPDLNEPDYWQPPLLRPCHHRPRRRAPETRDELPTPH
jgi:hypothetical protein